MSIILHTGLPGASKTLFTIGFVKEWAERESRQVYYYGITDLTLDWILLEDPKKWFEVPPNSIVLIDEAQQIYRNRSIRADAPPHVTELETHRHLGIDLVLITQHPSLIDPAVRKLTQTHRHVVRLWGMEASTVHMWNGVKEACEKSRGDSQKTKYIFDRSLYGVYKSAEVHTMKRRIPLAVKMLFFVPLFLAAAAYGVYALAIKPKISQVPAVVSSVGQGASGALAAPAGQVVDEALVDARKFVYLSTPRVVGLAHTAPKYDGLTRPDSVPVPAMCIIRAERCQCYTQQATKLQVPANVCLDIAHNGYFQDFNPSQNNQQSGVAQVPVAPGNG